MTKKAIYSAQRESLPELPLYLQGLVEAVQLSIQSTANSFSTLTASVNTKLDKTATAANSDKLQGHAASHFATADHTHEGIADANHNHDSVYSKLDHTHTAAQVGAYTKSEADGRFLGKTAKATDSAHADDADTVNGLTVLTAVPANAVFTDTHRPISDSVTSTSTTVSASSKAVKDAYDRGTQALNLAQELGETVTGLVRHLGPVDLSGNKFPAKPDSSAMWYVQKAGTVDGEAYGEGDSLVYTIDLDMFFKITDTTCISHTEADAKYLLKTGKAADASLLDGRAASSFANSSHSHTADQLPSASTSAKGIVQLSTATNSTSTSTAGTSSAVKVAYDKGVEALNKANTKLDASAKAADSAKLNGQAATYYATASGLTTTTNTANAAKTKADQNAGLITALRTDVDDNTTITGDFVLLVSHLTALFNEAAAG